MGLRARLAVFFVAITVVPLALAAVVVADGVARRQRDAAVAALQTARRAADTLLEVRRGRAGDLATDLAQRLAARPPGPLGPQEAERWLDAESAEALPRRADVALLLGEDGALLAGRASLPQFSAPMLDDDLRLDGLAAAAARASSPPGVLLEAREVLAGVGGGQRAAAMIVTGVWTDEALLDRLALGSGAAFVGDEAVLAATGEPPVLEWVADAGSGSVWPGSVDGREVLLTALPVDEGGTAELVLWIDAGQFVAGRLVLLLVVPVLLAAALGWMLAGDVVAPVRRAAEVARGVAGGDLQRRLEPRGGRELEDLARALNTMSVELAVRVEESARSREQLSRSLSRLGETLSSSLDLNRTLNVVVETGMDALRADRAALFLYTQERDALYAKVVRGMARCVPALRPGEGLVGSVAQSGGAVRLPADARHLAPPVGGDPTGEHQLLVPLHGRGRVVGVLSLLRDDPRMPFSASDLDTIRGFAGQASVAIENVLLHEEAQRLSVTDALTGLWNFRYFQIQADRELESAARFDRPMSLAIIDLDHFKDVNDTYGHQAGDAVLVEVARRIGASTRAPDVVARYGGEEFVVLLPDTGADGAVATAERITTAVSADSVSLDGRAGERASTAGAVRVTCSAGVATFPDHGTTLAALLRNADAALYTAKVRGRDRVVGAGASGLVELGDARRTPPGLAG